MEKFFKKSSALEIHLRSRQLPRVFRGKQYFYSNNLGKNIAEVIIS